MRKTREQFPGVQAVTLPSEERIVRSKDRRWMKATARERRIRQRIDVRPNADLPIRNPDARESFIRYKSRFGGWVPCVIMSPPMTNGSEHLKRRKR